MDTPLLLGVSASVQLLASDMELAAACTANVLITGASAADRSAVARMLHAGSIHRERPFVAAGGGSLHTLLHGEPVTDVADGGTIFLDDVCRISSEDQDLLLRFMESRGAGITTRVIAGSDGWILERVASTFRADLFYRLNVIHIAIPPLKQRREDVVVMFRHFLQVFSERAGISAPGLTAAAVAALERYDWPGNVAQLRGVAERLVSERVGTVTPSLLAFEITHASSTPPSAADGQMDSVIVRVVDESEDGPASSASRTREAG